MHPIINYDDFQNICRTCLFIGRLKPIIDTVIIEILYGIAGIQVQQDADLPQKICESCFKKIYKINEFAVQCKRNEITLNKWKTDYLKEHENDILIKEEVLQIKNEIENEDSATKPIEEIEDNTTKPIEFVDVKPETNTTIINTTSSISVNKKTHQCLECNKTFTRIVEYRKHMRLHKKVTFQCDVCSITLNNASALIEHQRTHPKQFPFTCEVCNKPIRHKTTLNRHILIHKRHSNIQCSLCFKTFNDLNALRIHRRTHILSPFVCKICHQSFIGLHYLHLHYRVKHQLEDGGDCGPIKSREGVGESIKSREVVGEPIRRQGGEIEPIRGQGDEIEPIRRQEINFSTITEQCHENKPTNNDDEEFGSGLKFQVDPKNLLIINDPSSEKNDSASNDKPKNVDDKRTRDRNFCIYCKTTVLNFVRHISRNHLKEPDVARVLSTPVGSRERKNLLTLLRKKGNYMINYIKCTKPVKKTGITNKFLPCIYCLGFYSTKQLWKHRKICVANPLKNARNNRPCAEAQNLLVQHLKVDASLRQLIFPRMRADEISLVAKNDPLICAYGARYIKIHDPEKHTVNVTSRKMRELAKLLIEIKKREPDINHLLQILHRNYFDLIVSAVKIIARFDDEKKIFASPTYAIQMSTSLKHCCEIVLNDDDVFDFVVADVVKEEIRCFVQLLEINWKLIVPQLFTDFEVKPTTTTTTTRSSKKIIDNFSINDVIKSKRVLVPWTTEQKHVVNEYFKGHIERKKAPKKTECEALIREYSQLLQNKNWLKIKVYVQNKYSK